MDGLVFDSVDLRQVPVQVGRQEYVLREANGAGARAYRNAMLRGARLGPDGKPVSIEGMADGELVLVQHCLVDKQGRQLHMQVLAGWPSRVLKALFQKAQEISDLVERDDSEGGLVKREGALAKELEEVRGKLTALRTPLANRQEDNGQGGGQRNSGQDSRQEGSREEDPTAARPEPSTAG
jgi:hypothetical protein